MVFDNRTDPFQRADDVGYVISEFLWFKGRPFYPVSALAQARISEFNLAAREYNGSNEDNLDLIFRMPRSEGGHYFEIILRSDEGTAYGGWAWGEELSYLDRFVNGYRVLAAYIEGHPVTFEYSARWHRYRPTSDLPISKSVFRIEQEVRGVRNGSNVAPVVSTSIQG
nr:hypothetical protein [Allorhizobium borbori]